MRLTDDDLSALYREQTRVREDRGACPASETLARAAAGALESAERDAVVAHIEGCHTCAEDFTIACALQPAVKDQPVTGTRERFSIWWSSLLSSPGTPNWSVRFALSAAVFAILAGGVWLLTETSRSRTTSERSVAEQRVPQEQEGKPLPLPEESAAPPRGAAPPPQLSIATFVLPPNLARDSRQGVVFVIPDGTRLVRLRLPLEPGDEYPAYRAELRTATGASVWRNDLVRPVRGGTAYSVVVDISPDILQSEKYELTLGGIENDGTRDLGYYYFSFVKQ